MLPKQEVSEVLSLQLQLPLSDRYQPVYASLLGDVAVRERRGIQQFPKKGSA